MAKTKGKDREYHAKLVIHELDNISNNQKSKIAEWLRNLATEVINSKKGEYAKVFTARFMK